jgi:pimeloyl-ACP methyl ester carboxylesterase
MNIRHRLFLLITVVLLVGAASASAQPKTLQPESHFAKLDGARVHYVSYGKGDDALVLIHGWTQSIDAAWRDQISEFAKHYRVIALDLPGHGKSDKPQFSKEPVPKDQPRKPFVYSMDHFARAVEAVMRDAKVKRAVLAGHSMGTPVARQFYRKYPEKTLAIIIVDGSLRPFSNQAIVDQLIANLRGPNYSVAIDQMFGMMFGPGLPAEAQQRIKASTANTPQYVLVSAFQGMADSGIWGEDKINLQVLALMAKNPFYPPNVEESFRGIAPKMEFHLWDGVGHFLMMEKPNEFNAAVIAWLNKNDLLKK